MSQELIILLITAGTLGFTHTLFGPDHYLPFIVIAKAKKWSLGKTTWVTFLCGLGHVSSSVVIGAVGIVFGVALLKLQALEAFRGNIAGWLLLGFGLAYFIWGLRKSWKNRSHKHPHLHEDGNIHEHVHTHVIQHAHIHIEKEEDTASLTPWVLFIIFVFGPCEVLIPLVMYPVAQASWSAMMLVVGTFSLVTVATMLTIVTLGTYGIKTVRFPFLEKNSEAVAGFSIMLCGIAIQFLGL
jgi:sulfite exporter TauE/SafE